jgi:predicted dehydrogenase
MDIGLIGCGRVSEYHMQAYKHIPEANVVVISDINLDRAKAFSQKWGIEKVFKDYKEILEMKDLDYVDICTPTTTHAEIACETAKLGHNVLLEKPMARSSIECDKIVNEVEKNHVKLCVMHNQLFLPLVMEAIAKVDSGEFPLAHFRVLVRESVELISAPKWIMTPEQGGALWETGAHCAYLQLRFLKKVERVSAVGVKLENPVHDHFVAFLESANKTTGIIEVSFLSKKTDIMFEMIGSDGQHMQILNYDFPVKLHKDNPHSILQGFYWDERIVTRKWTSFLSAVIRNRRLLQFLPQYNLISRYIEAIKNDTEPPVTPMEGRNTVRLLECINESLERNQPVAMN